MAGVSVSNAISGLPDEGAVLGFGAGVCGALVRAAAARAGSLGGACEGVAVAMKLGEGDASCFAVALGDADGAALDDGEALGRGECNGRSEGGALAGIGVTREIIECSGTGCALCGGA